MAVNSSCSAGSSIHAALFAFLIACAALFFGSAEAGAAHRVIDPEWHPATATWYGSADGDGSDGKTFKSISHVRSFCVSDR
jgi:expansin